VKLIKDKSDPRDGVYEIQPLEAAGLFDNRAKNRPFRELHAQTMSVEMKQGTWVLNGESIILSARTGKTLDGQHRERACVLANVPLTTYVTYVNEKDGVFETMDSGKSRTTADVIALNKQPHYKEQAAIAAMVLKFEVGVSRGPGDFNRGASARATRRDIIHRAKSDPGIEEAADFASKFYQKTKLFAKSHSGFVFYHATKKNKTKAAEFFRELAEQDGPRGGPTHILNKRMAASAHTLRDGERLAYLIKTWNAYVTGRPLTVLRFIKDEEFPAFA